MTLPSGVAGAGYGFSIRSENKRPLVNAAAVFAALAKDVREWAGSPFQRQLHALGAMRPKVPLPWDEWRKGGIRPTPLRTALPLAAIRTLGRE